MKSKSSLCCAPENAGRPVRQSGFTLMELLIVMAIIAILMLIAIPTVGSLKKKANDLSAVQSVHTIMVGKVCQGNEPIDKVIKWAESELEGLLRT